MLHSDMLIYWRVFLHADEEQDDTGFFLIMESFYLLYYISNEYDNITVVRQ